MSWYGKGGNKMRLYNVLGSNSEESNASSERSDSSVYFSGNEDE
jgi:hypothetical protein